MVCTYREEQLFLQEYVSRWADEQLDGLTLWGRIKVRIWGVAGVVPPKSWIRAKVAGPFA